MTKIKVERMDHQGRGIGYINDKITFIENALPNEVVDVEIIKETKKYNDAIVLDYVEKSNSRVKPFCQYYEKCGGCKLQHLSYENTISYKIDKIKNIFEHNKIVLPEIIPVINDMPKNYRNKLSLKIDNGKVGFYEEKSHDLIEVDYCAIAKNSINDFLSQISELKIKNGLITIRSNYNDELLIVITTEEEVIFDPDMFKGVKIVGVVLNKKTIYGNNFFYERMNNCLFKVSYDAFFQINPSITSKLLQSRNIILIFVTFSVLKFETSTFFKL